MSFFYFLIVGMCGAALAVLLQTAFLSWLNHIFNLPILTFPFITSTWIIMLTRTKWLAPIIPENGYLCDCKLSGSGHKVAYKAIDNSINGNTSANKCSECCQCTGWTGKIMIFLGIKSFFFTLKPPATYRNAGNENASNL